MLDTKTVSLAGSDELFWEDVEDYAKKHGFTTTSGYIQYLLEKDVLGIRKKVQGIIVYIMLMLIIVMILLMLIIK